VDVEPYGSVINTRIGGTQGEAELGLMDIGRTETPCPPDHDTAFTPLPLKHGPWSDAELLAHLGRDRDLALGRMGAGLGKNPFKQVFCLSLEVFALHSTSPASHSAMPPSMVRLEPVM
jgi:hypothetical protein